MLPIFIPCAVFLIQFVFSANVGADPSIFTIGSRLQFGVLLQNAYDSSLGHEYARKAEKHHRNGQYRLAVDYYTRAIELGCDPPVVFSNRGAARSALGENESAIRDFNEAIRRGMVQLVYTNRGIAYMRQNSYELAIKDFTKALENGDPNRIILKRGVAYWRSNQIPSAIQDFDKAVRDYPRNPDCFRFRGTMRLNALKDYVGAISDFETVAKLDPTEVDAYLGKADAFKALGWKKEYELELGKALKADPKHPCALMYRGLCALEKGDLRSANDNFELAMRLEESYGLPKGSSSQDYCFLRGQLWYYQGQIHQKKMGTVQAAICFDHARAEMSRAIQLQPHGIAYYQYRSLAFRALNRHAEAEKDEEKVDEIRAKIRRK